MEKLAVMANHSLPLVSGFFICVVVVSMNEV